MHALMRGVVNILGAWPKVLHTHDRLSTSLLQILDTPLSFLYQCTVDHFMNFSDGWPVPSPNFLSINTRCYGYWIPKELVYLVRGGGLYAFTCSYVTASCQPTRSAVKHCKSILLWVKLTNIRHLDPGHKYNEKLHVDVGTLLTVINLVSAYSRLLLTLLSGSLDCTQFYTYIAYCILKTRDSTTTAKHWWLT
jgi:hypothetical protein